MTAQHTPAVPPRSSGPLPAVQRGLRWMSPALAVTAIATVAIAMVGRAVVLVSAWPVVDTDNTCGAVYRPDIWAGARRSWCEPLMAARIEAVILYVLGALVTVGVAIWVFRRRRASQPELQLAAHPWALIGFTTLAMLMTGRAVLLLIVTADQRVLRCAALYRPDLWRDQGPWCDTIMAARAEAVLVYVILAGLVWWIVARRSRRGRVRRGAD